MQFFVGGGGNPDDLPPELRQFIAAAEAQHTSHHDQNRARTRDLGHDHLAWVDALSRDDLYRVMQMFDGVAGSGEQAQARAAYHAGLLAQLLARKFHYCLSCQQFEEPLPGLDADTDNWDGPWAALPG